MIENIIWVYALNLLGMMFPGPDFFVIVRNSLRAGFGEVVFTALGIAVGCVFHVSFALYGVAAFSTYLAEFFFVVKIGGAMYLGYLGVKSFWLKPIKIKPLLETAADEAHSKLTDKNVESVENVGVEEVLGMGRAFTEGFLCNILNIKAIIFFISIFSQLMGTERLFWLDLSYVIGIPLMAFVWFTSLARVLALDFFQTYFKEYQVFLGRVMGVMLIIFAGIALFVKI